MCYIRTVIHITTTTMNGAISGIKKNIYRTLIKVYY